MSVRRFENNFFTHIALTRDSEGKWRFFRDGKKIAQSSVDGPGVDLTQTQLFLGRNKAGSYQFNGRYDDLRITKVCRYTEDFDPTPPIIFRTFIPKNVFFTQNLSASYQVALVGAVGDVTFELIDGDVPDGISFDDETGILSGTPATTGPYHFVIQATDDLGQLERSFSGTVS